MSNIHQDNTWFFLRFVYTRDGGAANYEIFYDEVSIGNFIMAVFFEN